MFIALVWRSYSGTSDPQLWPSRELGNIIVDVTLYVLTVASY